MRVLLNLVGLLLVLAAMAWLAKGALTGAGRSTLDGASKAHQQQKTLSQPATPQEIQQQVKQVLDEALKSRSLPAEQ